ncbi:MAG: hypothetical protein QOJ15_9903 [Bradyrhizobium sp.]|jgi:hypothetical protein|nr:hypothetical protein [Bradyrhizobium sp.]
MGKFALAAIATEAVTSIEDVGSRIEDVFAKVGGDLGRAHEMFGELTRDLSAASRELSGSKIDGASVALQDIAASLKGLAEVLPQETALLGAIGKSAAQASVLLRHLIKHIQMITVIARSSRIEASSLDGNRGDFLSFTQEASDLANSVQLSIAACSKDQEHLSAALEKALSQQQEFEKRYRDQLLSVSADLISVYSEIKDRQAKSSQLAELARASTVQIGDAVGGAIVTLQAGDSARQRLEHICRGLRMAAGMEIGPAPACRDTTDGLAAAAPLICLLQAAQLNDTISSFEADIGGIGRTLKALSTDSTKIVGHGRALFGGPGDDMSSFLSLMQQKLAQAIVLISACGRAKKSVDASISILEDMLGKFRVAISALGETIVDIILIGMNAGLKASQLGAQGRAFVVIANELKTTADHISAGARMLQPVLDNMARSADSLKGLRLEEDSLNVADTENLIISAIREIEAGNGQLSQLMSHLTRESAEFEALMTSAKSMMSALGEKSAALPGVAARLEDIDPNLKRLSSSEVHNAGEFFDDLYSKYTMVGERKVHHAFSNRFGLAPQPELAAAGNQETVSDEVLFF